MLQAKTETRINFRDELETEEYRVAAIRLDLFTINHNLFFGKGNASKVLKNHFPRQVNTS